MKDNIVIVLETDEEEVIQLTGKEMITIQKEYDLNLNHQDISGFCHFISEWLKKEKRISVRIERIRWDLSCGVRSYRFLKEKWEKEKEFKRNREKQWLREFNSKHSRCRMIG